MGVKSDAEKARFWRKAVRDAARSGLSTREFCRQHNLHESQFYWWQRRLEAGPTSPRRKQAAETPSFALVSEEPRAADAGIEVVLAGGRRLRIAKGVDEATLRSVLAALDEP
jgi:transposase-like protein